jgi:hypothetical protein
MRNIMTFDKIRNTMLFGIAGLGAAAGIAMGPTAAQAAEPTPVADTAPAATTGAPAESMISKYDGALQPNGYYCGPAATRIALSAHGAAPTFDSLASELGTTPEGTKSIDDIARVLNKHRGAGTYTSVKIEGSRATPEQTEKLRTDVMDAINHGDPVVANIAGTVVDNNGETHQYLGGHYVTITGYTDGGRTVRVTDPADRVGSNNYQLPVEKMAHWIATRGYSS